MFGFQNPPLGIPCPEGVDDLTVLWNYSGTPRRLVVRGKEEPRSPCFPFLRDSLFSKVQTLGLEPGPVLAPPASLQRLWKGWHLADELASVLRHRLGWGREGLRFKRQGFSKPQAALNAAERRMALEGRFRVFCRKRAVPPRVWLLDDVLTTGATLTECARALHHVGVERVGAWALCRSAGRMEGLHGYTDAS